MGICFMIYFICGFIVFLFKSTYSLSLRWLQFIFQKHFSLLVSNGMRSIRIKDWSDLNPGEMFDDLILPEIPNGTKKKSSLQKIGVGLFSCQEYTRLSGWWNLHISTNSLSSIQSFINAWDFVLVVEFPPILSISRFNIFIWPRFILMYDINIKFKVIIIWTIYIAQINHESIDLNVYYNVSIIRICTYFMYVNGWPFWNKIRAPLELLVPCAKYIVPDHFGLHICSLYNVECISCKIIISQSFVSSQENNSSLLILCPNHLVLKDTILIKAIKTYYNSHYVHGYFYISNKITIPVSIVVWSGHTPTFTQTTNGQHTYIHPHTLR